MKLQAKPKRKFKAKMKREALSRRGPAQYITLIKVNHPMVQQLAHQMLPEGAWRARASEGTELWAYPSDAFQPAISYRTPDGQALISMRTIRESSDEWQRIRPGA